MFQETLDVRPHLLVLNKIDLADVSSKQVRRFALICAWNSRMTISKPKPDMCPAEPFEDSGKKGSEECFVH